MILSLKLLTSTSPENPKKPQKSLTWLHLSDIHFRSGRGASQFAQNLVIDKFISALPSLLAEWELEPDFVFLTGDISFSGKKEEYEVGKSFLKQLILEELNSKPRLFFVPGNHDVMWNMIDYEFDKTLRGRLNNHDSVNRYWLESPMDKQIGLLRFRNFFDFSNECSMLGQPSMENQEYFYVT